MAHQDDSFWIAAFKKSPIIAIVMALCGIIGGVGGGWYFVPMAEFVRAYLCVIISCTLGGLFVGLAIGVLIDSLLHFNRGDDSNQRRPNRRPFRSRPGNGTPLRPDSD